MEIGFMSIYVHSVTTYIYKYVATYIHMYITDSMYKLHIYTIYLTILLNARTYWNTWTNTYVVN